MKMLSRFRKEKKSDGADSQAVAEPDDEGLLMPAPPAQSSADSGDDLEAAVDAMPAAAKSGDGGEGEAPAAPAEDDDLLAAAQAPPGEIEAKAEEPAETDADDDDPLSAFKDVEAHSDLADITKDIEEITIADLLEQVRDVRGMLPATPTEDEDAA